VYPANSLNFGGSLALIYPAQQIFRDLQQGKKKRPQGSPKEENCRLIRQEVSEEGCRGSVEIGYKFYM
jgi:hypothetical protein